jgi:hypothetical protein
MRLDGLICFAESPGVGGGRSSGAEVRKLKEQNLQLKEENNLLQYKIEILLDMVHFLTII